MNKFCFHVYGLFSRGAFVSVLRVFMLLLISFSSQAQLTYYVDNFNGGVIGSGYSPAYNGGGSDTIDLNYSGTVRKGFLIVGRYGTAADLDIILNGDTITLDNTSQVSSFISFPYGGASGIHVIDITAIIDTVNYITVPVQTGPSDRYADFYLLCMYENASAGVGVTVFLNTDNFSTLSYTYNFPFPLDSSQDIGLAIYGGYICDDGSDGQTIEVDGTVLGDIGGPDIGSGTCGGVKSSFSYENGTLSGFNSNNPNQAMTGLDALSNVAAIRSGSSFDVDYYPTSAGNTTNAVWAGIVVYADTNAVDSLCPEVTGLDTSDVTSTTATVFWNSALGAVSYTLQYRQSGFPTWTTIISADTFEILTGLSPSTLYQWQVSTTCDSSNSVFSTLSFFTSADRMPRYGFVPDVKYNNPARMPYIYQRFIPYTDTINLAPSSWQTILNLRAAVGDIVINITTTADSIGDQLVLIMSSDNLPHTITGTGIDFTEYFPTDTFQFAEATRFFIFNGSEFVPTASQGGSGGSGTVDTSNFWNINGNTGTSSTANFMGTTDDQDVVFKTNSIQQMRMDSLRGVYIGSAMPTSDWWFEVFQTYYTDSLTHDLYSGGRSGLNRQRVANSSNTGVGYEAMAGGTHDTCIQNTAIGREAGYTTTNGSFNTWVGHDCGWQNTEGNQNVAVGHSALFGNRRGFQNTALGYNALFTDTATDEQVAVGASALYANTTGIQNTAVGTGALNANTSGGGNVAIGYATAQAITTSSRVTFVGHNAGTSASGADNVGLGHQALTGSSGVQNTALGTKAGENNTTGANNIYIGYDAEASANNFNNAIALGASSIVGCSNCMSVGDSATTMKVGIGTRVPLEILHVVGNGKFTGSVKLTDSLVVTNKTINTTAADTATINSSAGRFRKDTSGTTFTLTNSYVTANSIVLITLASDPGNSNAHNVHVTAGSGNFIVTFELAPSSDADINFLVVN